MEISRKTDYALRMLADLVHEPTGVVSARTSARENGVPYSFARSIQHDLSRAGIVENTRGAAGGMKLAVDAHNLTLLQLVEAVQGPVIVAGCAGACGPHTACPRLAECQFSPVWCNAERLMREYLASVTLYQLVAEQRSPVFEGTFPLVSDEEARRAADIWSASK